MSTSCAAAVPSDGSPDSRSTDSGTPPSPAGPASFEPSRPSPASTTPTCRGRVSSRAVTRSSSDCAALLDSWLVDVGLEQLPDGTVPWYVPVIPGAPMWTPIRPGAGWGDAAALTPSALYLETGDEELLRRHYRAARIWVDLVTRLAGPSRLWDTGFQLGDWLDPTAPANNPAAGATDRYLIATAYFAWSARHVSLAARVLGNVADAEEYEKLAEEIADAFRGRYLMEGGRLTSDSQ